MRIRDTLATAGIDKLDAEVLMAAALRKNRSWVLAHDDMDLTGEAAERFADFVRRRRDHEPVAYILGEKEFYGRNFIVTQDVLIPRPSTETLVEETLRFLENPSFFEHEPDTGISVIGVPLRKKNPAIIIDVGTGSGVIAITLLLESTPPRVRTPWKGDIVALDTSEKALAVAKQNAERHQTGSRIKFLQMDGAEFVRTFPRPFLIVSNPPYIPQGEKLKPDVTDYEPKQALFAGDDGLDVLLPLVEAARENPECVGMVLELRTDQVSSVV